MNTTASWTAQHFRRSSRHKWLLLTCILATGCIVQQNNAKRTNAQPHDARCPYRQTAHITGWIEQIDRPCAIIVTNDDKHLYIASQSLPTGTREGDYLLRGKLQQKQMKAALRETKRLLKELHQKPINPRIIAIPGPKSLDTRPRQRYQPGRWKRFAIRRNKRREQRRKQRYQHRPWRQKRTSVWQHKKK